MSRSRTQAVGIVAVVALALGAVASPSAADRRAAPDRGAHPDGHSYDLRPADAAELADALGMRVPARSSARTALQAARTVSVSPRSGPDFEMPFTCGTSWSGSTRSSHSPSYYSIDFNATDDYRKPVLASAPGTVVLVRSLTYSYGKYVVVDHGGGWTTLYAHLDSLAASVGQRVDQGDLIGRLGTTGGSTGPHLHFEQRKDGAYFNPWFTRTSWRFGATAASANCGDRPVVGDWDDDGVDEVGSWKPRASTSNFRLWNGNRRQVVRWGAAGHTPVPGDFDGDGRTQVGTKLLGSTTWTLRGGAGAVATVPGVGGAYDVPLAGDWNGDGLAELGWYRWSNRTFYLRMPDRSVRAVAWGASGEWPVTGDWDGDGTDDVGSFAPSTRTWKLRVPRGTSSTTQSLVFGGGNDLPVTGDWDGDGRTDVGTWRPATAKFFQRTVRNGTRQVTAVPFGLARG